MSVGVAMDPPIYEVLAKLDPCSTARAQILAVLAVLGY